jgi:hypothetical protein
MQATTSSQVQPKSRENAALSFLGRLFRLREFALILMIILIGFALQL